MKRSLASVAGWGRSGWLPPILYASIALFVLWDLLAPGYVLTLDMMFTPRINVSDIFYGFEISFASDLPILAALNYLGKIAPMWLWQKLILFLILFLSGYSAHRLCPASYAIGKYFAGLLYMLNPFVYVRFVAGQWKILLTYAIAPFLVIALIDFLENPTPGRAIKVGLLLALTTMLNPSSVFLVVLLFAAFLLFKLFQSRGLSFRKMLSGLGISLGIVLATNLYWLVPTLKAPATIIGQISYKDLQVFTAQAWGTGFNAVFSVFSLHGFWRGGYNYITQLLPGWYVAFGIILFLSVWGAVLFWNHPGIGYRVKVLAIVGAVAGVLGTGVSAPLFSNVYTFLFDTIPFFQGMRDSQRFVALLALAYSFLGGLAASELYTSFGQMAAEKVKGWMRLGGATLAIAALALPWLYSLNMLWGFGRELETVDFPPDWHEVNQNLTEQEGDFQVLFLPWHGYMDFSWNPRQRIMNPSNTFFQRPIIRGGNIEVFDIENQSTNPIQHYIRFLLDHRANMTKLGSLLAPLNIKYVLLAKEADYQDYDFLYSQEDLAIVQETPNLILFQNEAPTAKFYFVRQAEGNKDWDEVIKSVEGGESLVGSAFLLNEPTGENPISSDFTPLSYERLSPVKYKLGIPDQGYVIFAAPYDTGWELRGEAPQANIGMTNAFPAKQGEATLYYRPFTLLLPLYIFSGASTLAAILFLVWMARKKVY